MAVDQHQRIHSVQWLANQMREGLLDTSIAMQRQFVWSREMKSNLIVTLLRGAPIPSLCFEKSENGFIVLDGKQRTLSICSFISDEFALHPVSLRKFKFVDGEDVTGKRFSNLNEKQQHRLLDYQLSITVLGAMDEEDRNFVFYMGNQGKPLSRVELLPAVLGDAFTKEIMKLCEHPFIKNKIKLSRTSVNRRDDFKVIIQYLAIKSGREIEFSGRELVSFCDDIRQDEEQVSFDGVRKVLDYIDKAFEISTGPMNKLSNIPYVLYAASIMMESGEKPEEFARGLDSFFENPSPAFIEPAQRGGANKSTVAARAAAIAKGVAEHV